MFKKKNSDDIIRINLVTHKIGSTIINNKKGALEFSNAPFLYVKKCISTFLFLSNIVLLF